MSEPTATRTAQEAFWAGEFGTAYSERNAGDAVVASNVRFFARALQAAGPVGSCLEIGANIGLNLRALRVLYPALAATGIEINPDAARQLASVIGPERVRVQSVLEYDSPEQFDLVLVKGLLIHINPDKLPLVYDRMYASSRRFILVAEYYNPTPVAIPYRGHADRLFKRDFAGELLDRFADLRLLDYGFVYRRDPAFPQDDVTWFLLDKRS
jgi:spore coat polysaccharide biosynthesis protein SpsF